MNRRRLILLVCLLGLGGSLFYAFVKYPRQKTVAQLKFAPGAVASPRTTTSDDRVVHLHLLQEKTARFTGYRRNIFQSLFREPLSGKGRRGTDGLIPPPPPPPPQPKSPIPAPVPPPPLPEAGDVVSSSVPADMAKFTFLGFLVKDKKKTIFLSKDKEIVLVRKGDNFAGGGYQATDITDEALTIKVLSDGREIVIPLVENRPLIAPRRR
jgi:hypothetical protein